MPLAALSRQVAALEVQVFLQLFLLLCHLGLFPIFPIVSLLLLSNPSHTWFLGLTNLALCSGSPIPTKITFFADIFCSLLSPGLSLKPLLDLSFP